MRTLAIGDIHGCLRAFDAILDIVQPQTDDLIVTLGDYVDRGPDSKGVLDRLIELHTRCKLVALKGNHDFMMIKARDDREEFKHWLGYGGKETLQSYGADPNWGAFAKFIPEAHWAFLEKTCVAYHELETHFFVHANVYADMPLAEQSDYMLFWEKIDAFGHRPHESGKTMICGHTAQRSGRPLVLNRAVCIDTWVYGEGWLTCLDVNQEMYWQASQRGETRAGWLKNAD